MAVYKLKKGKGAHNQKKTVNYLAHNQNERYNVRIIKECIVLKCAHSHNDMIDSGVMTIREKYHDFKKKNL